MFMLKFHICPYETAFPVAHYLDNPPLSMRHRNFFVVLSPVTVCMYAK